MDVGTISFNGISSNNATFGIKNIRRTERPILPETRDKISVILGKDGLFDYGKDYEPRYITCEFTIEGAGIEQLRGNIRAIANWLNVRRAEELIFWDEDDKYYLARPIGIINNEQILNYGLFTVTFIIPEVYAYSVDLNEESSAGGILPFNNQGTVEAPLTFKATIQAEISEFSLSLTGNEYVTIEYALGASDEIIVDTANRTIMLNDSIDLRPYRTINSSWLYVPVGEGSLTPDPVGTHIEIAFRERYL